MRGIKMEEKDRNLFNLEDIDDDSTELKSKNTQASTNITLDEFETDELNKEELLAQKIKEAAAKKKLTHANNEVEKDKKKWTKIFERKDANESEDEPILTMEEVDATSRSNTATRYYPDLNQGLNETQVNERILSELVNNTTKTYSKTYKQIFFSNIFTFFNVLCVIIAIALILVGSWGDLFFALILVLNTSIGIYQEIKAKHTIDKLTIVTAPTSTVIRDGVNKEIPVKDNRTDNASIAEVLQCPARNAESFR